MSNVKIFSGKIYNNPAFKAQMNINYASVDAMKASIKLLQDSGQIDLPTMLYGQYQPILAPLALSSTGGNKVWLREMGFARMQLSAQPSTTPLSKDQPDVIPLTKCDLLDACLRKCFNQQPDPIPIVIDVKDKQKGSANQGIHDVELVWEYKRQPPDNPNVPSLLKFTMICPFLLAEK